MKPVVTAEVNMGEVEKLRDALSRISEISRDAVNAHGGDYESRDAEVEAVCTPKALPVHLQVRAAQTATEVNPMNAPAIGFMPDDDALSALVTDPLRIAAITAKYWGPARRTLTVSFMESTPSDLRNRIIGHLNAWQCGIQFVQTNGTGQVRISRETEGYWSYLGTDVLHIAVNRPTMSLQRFSMGTSEREFRRVVRHEGGHTLGFPHEHMRRELVARIDREKAYEYFRRTQGWTPAMVDQQVLTPLDERSLIPGPVDQTSIMCYQLPGEITRDGKPIVGGPDINATDRTFARRIYPPAPTLAEKREAEPERYEEQFREDAGFSYEPVFAD
jgi:hypothetical protein